MAAILPSQERSVSDASTEVGTCNPTASFNIARRIFLKGLSLVYLLAFAGTIPQVATLLGSEGLFPATDFLAQVSAEYSLFQRLWLVPSVFWIGTSVSSLQFVLTIGALAALLGLFGVFQHTALFICWLLYLSLVAVGGPFFQFQWDALLLEAGFLSLLLASKSEHSRLNPQATGLFLLHWLCFRLLFSSGMAKLLSGDTAWTNFEALQFHFETQPLPTPLAWYVHRLPESVLWFLSGLTLFLEIVVPFFFFFTVKLRRLAAVLSIAFQILIIATGNYGFFNLLTIVLLILFFDDALLRRFLRQRSEGALSPRLRSVSGVLLFLLSLVPLSNTLFPSLSLPAAVRSAYNWTRPFHIANPYGLFAVMTPERLVVVLEVSNDGVLWDELYPFWQPQREELPPRFIAPYHPRLDWQLWFAAFSAPQRNRWFTQLVGGLLSGSEPIRSQFERTELPIQIKQVRALLYRYEFTHRHDKKILGRWWKRTLLGIYLHPVQAPSREPERLQDSASDRPSVAPDDPPT